MAPDKWYLKKTVIFNLSMKTNNYFIITGDKYLLDNCEGADENSLLEVIV